MSDINQITLSGNLGQDPEFKDVNGTALAILSIGVSQYRGPNRDADTAWWKVNLWGNRAKVAEYLSKGDRVVVVGQVVVDKVERQDGTTGYFYKVDANDILLPNNGGGAGKRTQGRSTPKKKDPVDEDLPW